MPRGGWPVPEYTGAEPEIVGTMELVGMLELIEIELDGSTGTELVAAGGAPDVAGEQKD